jgi:hypothetical protein
MSENELSNSETFSRPQLEVKQEVKEEAAEEGIKQDDIKQENIKQEAEEEIKIKEEDSSE